MKDRECVSFLQWCLPLMRFRWKGFRKVRTQVCKRIERRFRELRLNDLSEYKKYLEEQSQEWEVLDSLCFATISRFYRDRKVFQTLQNRVLPALAQQVAAQEEGEVRCWSVGCASGEEPYTLQIIWELFAQPQSKKKLAFRIIATDTDPKVLERTKMGCYPKGSLRELQEELGVDLIEKAFIETEKGLFLRENFKENVEFIKQDIRKVLPESTFHLILCRNLVFTYFEEDLQHAILHKIMEKLLPQGVLVIGSQESLPKGFPNIIPFADSPSLFQKKD